MATWMRPRARRDEAALDVANRFCWRSFHNSHPDAGIRPAPGFGDNCGIDRAGPTSIHADISLRSRLFSTKGNAMRKMLSLTALIGGLVAASTAQADITIGFVTSLSGPGASIGIPYGRGIQAAVRIQERGQRREDQADPARRRLRSLRRDPQRAQAHRGRKGRSPDRHRGRAVDHRDDGGRERTEGADDRGLAGHRTAQSGRSMGHFRSATRLADGQGGRRPHEARRHQEHRLHRLLRRLGRSRLQRRQGSAKPRPASRW